MKVIHKHLSELENEFDKFNKFCKITSKKNLSSTKGSKRKILSRKDFEIHKANF